MIFVLFRRDFYLRQQGKYCGNRLCLSGGCDECLLSCGLIRNVKLRLHGGSIRTYVNVVSYRITWYSIVLQFILLNISHIPNYGRFTTACFICGPVQFCLTRYCTAEFRIVSNDLKPVECVALCETFYFSNRTFIVGYTQLIL